MSELQFYEKVIISPIACLIRIFSIEKDEVVLEVGQSNFLT